MLLRRSCLAHRAHASAAAHGSASAVGAADAGAGTTGAETASAETASAGRRAAADRHARAGALQEMFHTWLTIGLPPRLQHDLKASMMRAKRRVPQLILGTMCSGTDLHSKGMKRLMSVIKMVFGEAAYMPVFHSFSAEKKLCAQKFIKHYVRPEFLFDDAKNMSQEDFARDCLSKSLQAVPCCHVLAAGIVCSSASKMNNKASKLRRCIEFQEAATGETAEAVRSYIVRFRPAAFLLENVPGLDIPEDDLVQSNLEYLVSILEAAGYTVAVKIMCPTHFGFPTTRKRVYLVGIVSGLPPLDDADSTSTTSSLQQDFDDVYDSLKAAPISLREVLLPHENKEAMDMDEYFAATSHKKNKSVPDDSYKWQEEHKAAFLALRLAWPPSLERMLAELGATINHMHFRAITQRMREVIYLLHRRGDLLVIASSSVIQIVDLNPSLKRIKVSTNTSPAIVPSGVYWINDMSGGRLMQPEECFALQGWKLDELDLDEEFQRSEITYRDAVGLAGNAFECHCVMAATIVLLLHLKV